MPLWASISSRDDSCPSAGAVGHAAPVIARFYFYFRDEAAARDAVPRLEHEGLSVDVRLGADDSSWLALGTTTLRNEDELDEYEERFEELAGELDADYDGYDRN